MHSTVVGGSSAERVMNCPASVNLSKDIPQGPSSSYAMEGTALHGLMERLLLSDNPKALMETFVGMTIEGVAITKELFYDKIIPAWDATSEAFTRFDVEEYEPEARVHFQTIPGAFGTCDIFAKGRDNLVVLLDYKFGDGYMVSPVDNAQLKFYAAAAIEDPNFKDWWTGDLDQPIAVGIIQPAQDHVLSTWMTTVREVTQFTIELMIAVDKSNKSELAPRTGDWCKWCPAASICPEKMKVASAVNGLKQEHLNELSLAMVLAEELEPWIKQVKAMTQQALEAGQEVDGYKLVKKRAMRKWIDEASMLDTLKKSRAFKADDYITEKLVTAPQFEKLCKQKDVDFSKYEVNIISVSSGTTLAPVDDPREGVTISANRQIPENLAKQMQN